MADDEDRRRGWFLLLVVRGSDSRDWQGLAIVVAAVLIVAALVAALIFTR